MRKSCPTTKPSWSSPPPPTPSSQAAPQNSFSRRVPRCNAPPSPNGAARASVLLHSCFQHSPFPRRGGSASPPPTRKAPSFLRLVPAVALQRHSPPPLNAGGGGQQPRCKRDQLPCSCAGVSRGAWVACKRAVCCVDEKAFRWNFYIYVWMFTFIWYEWQSLSQADRALAGMARVE